MTKPKPDRVALAAAQARISAMKQEVAFLRGVRENIRREFLSIEYRIEALQREITIEAESVKPRKEP